MNLELLLIYEGLGGLEVKIIISDNPKTNCLCVTKTGYKKTAGQANDQASAFFFNGTLNVKINHLGSDLL